MMGASLISDLNIAYKQHGHSTDYFTGKLPTTTTANQIRDDSHTATGASVDVDSLVVIWFMRTDG